MKGLLLFTTIVYGLVLPQYLYNLPFNLLQLASEKSTGYKQDNAGYGDALVDKSSFNSWIDDQVKFSWKYLLRNIGNSTYSEDADIYPGVIVASPSKIMPNYYYQWTRDSALTIRSLIHYLQDNQQNDVVDQSELQYLVEQYIWNNYHLQRLDTLSGDFENGGLGEPKYHVNNTAFNENWGRPQNDGPGLRVSSIIGFLDMDLPFQSELNTTFIYNEIVKPDLQFIMHNWQKNSFDLWEEINSLHFFTSITQLKGLFDGIKFAKKVGEADDKFLAKLQNQYDTLNKFISDFYISTGKNYVIESPKITSRNGLDSAVLLGSIHSHDMNDQDDFIPFNIDNNYIINHLLNLVTDMKSRYPVNHNKLGIFGIGIGRYPEDVYDGYGTSEGNPWFISTATASELIYKLIYKLTNDKKDLIITQTNKSFFNIFLNNIDLSDDYLIVEYDSPVFDQLIKNLFKFSDSFLEVIKDHNDMHGGISEQFNKYHGFMQGARDLTWSYSSLINAFRWRSRVVKIVT